MFGVGHVRRARSRVVVAAAVGILVLAPLTAHAEPPLYLAAAQYPVGAQPRSVATVDVDGDGALDVVSANAGDGSVSVLRGLGDGTLGPAAAIAVGASPTTVSVGDFNHDNDPDLAVTTFATAPATPVVSVLLGSAGASFGPPVAYPLAQDALGGAVADVDADGNLDVIAVDAFGVSVLTGAADGSFGAAVREPVGTFLASVSVGDLNGDHDPDLVLGQFVGQVLVLLGGPGAGFGAPTGVTAGLTPDSPAVGDVNGDGHLDLAVADFSAPEVAVLLGAGDGTFAPAATYGTGVVNGLATHVAIARLDGDAHPDIVVTNSFTNDVSVLINVGHGSFGPATNFAVGAGPFAAAVGDLNADGAGDLVVANSGAASVSVLLGVIPNHPPDCAAVTAAPARLWPPNHGMRPVVVSTAPDPDRDDVATTITGVTQDEPVESFFGLEITPDAKLGIKPGEVLLRAERNWSGDGRVYRISFTATDIHGAACSGVATVGVPHGAHSTAVDSGASYNSLQPGQRPAWWWKLFGGHH
jgi:VCBS repeat protein